MSTRSTSPDPLTLPSSPLVRANRRSSVRPLASRSSNIAQSSPSKSFVMETGKAGDASPWRIKVTVEAEPKEASSPSKRKARSTKVLLKHESSSPARGMRGRASLDVDGDANEPVREVKRPQRKRKGAPIRRTGARSQSAIAEPTTEEDEPVNNISSPPKRPAPRPSRRKGAAEQATERHMRLDRAREELNLALQQAMGSSDQPPDLQRDHDDDDEDDEPSNDEPGDMTVANEDFTMVSVETLQSMRANTSQLLENSGVEFGDKSAISVSYMPSSPPLHTGAAAVEYPDVTVQAEQAKDKAETETTYDAMSWKPTRPIKTATPLTSKVSPTQQQQQRLHSEPTDWRLQRQAVSKEIEHASASQVIIVDDDTQAGAAEGYDDQTAADADIWQEEASRSVDETDFQDQQHAQPTRSPQMADLFSDQPVKPLRSKIPRTWRRTSGMDFSYVDSPEYGALKTRVTSAPSTDGEGGGAGSRSSGVLTPPSSGDEPGDGTVHGVEESDTSLTHPDAAGTQLQAQAEDVASATARNDAVSPLSDSSSSVTSPDGEDTGMFWQTHLPNVYQRRTRPRPQRQRAMDLSDLLNLNKSSPAKARVEAKSIVEPRMEAQTTSSAKSQKVVASGQRPLAHTKGVTELHGNTLLAQPKEKVVDSPLRRSLLKSSKIGGFTLPNQGLQSSDSALQRQSNKDAARSRNDSGAEFRRSFSNSIDSQASDQRQLLGEMAIASTKKERRTLLRHGEAPGSDHPTSDVEAGGEAYSDGEEQHMDNEAEEPDEDEDEHGTDAPSRSYEERLNLDSPQKIRVNFNDSDGNSSLLAPKKEYPPLFGQAEPASAASKRESIRSPPSVTLVSRRTAAPSTEAQQGILSRLSSNFWSAVVRPSGPTLVEPKQEPVYSPSLRALIRSRYGVMGDQQPWTMAHMRTLHRLLNSCTSGRIDSVVPKSGPLPSQLENVVGKELKSVTDFRWTFTEQHAHVVDAFMQVLVPTYITNSICRGEIEFIGDYAAKEHRGMLAGRHGDDLVWGDGTGVKLPKGDIRMDFVVRALGNCVMANIETARKEREKADEERKRKAVIERERREWERSMGVQSDEDEADGYDNDVDDADDGEDEVLHKVRSS